MKKLFFTLIIISIFASCKKEYRCDCYQEVGGSDTTLTLDTSYTLTGEGINANKACDQFDSEETEFGITKTVDCEPF